MITIYDLKPRFQNLLRPLCAKLVSIGITANQVTIFAAILSAVGGAAILFNPTSPVPLFLLPVLLFIRMALNAIDGMMAREFNQKSNLGAILNELTDVIADVLLYLPFALIPGINAYLIVALVMLGIMVEMIGVVSIQIGASRRYDGPFGKSDRAFAFGFVAVVLVLGFVPVLWLNILLAALVALSCYTIFNRAKQALKEAGDLS
ncbi:CDP-alcohol phosphatidyltransferase family protein [Kiloniella majae]|uniref:CDP-alcohol phosphatidyltransferase family protein n=1 Tax=Kiloniella majae TaxID=1938558 RepID=UPI000A2773FD|nr:CDP-alcohol phosphatidyltransferase family protein [Kiloniella majae]